MCAVPPPDTLLIHLPGRIAFGATGLLELTLADVFHLHSYHVSQLILAIDAGDEEQQVIHRAAEKTFRLAMQEHTERRFGRAA